VDRIGGTLLKCATNTAVVVTYKAKRIVKRKIL
jgi:hypothetical protein